MSEPEQLPDDPGNDQEAPDYDKRLQDQSAILGKVVNQSNNFAKDLSEVKEALTNLTGIMSKQAEEPVEDKEDKPKKAKVQPDDTAEGSLSFNEMASRLAAIEAKEARKAEAAKKSQLARSLEHHGVDPAASDKVAKLVMVDLGDSVEIDDSGQDIKVNVKYADEVMPVDSFAKMWLESDEGNAFKSDRRKSPTPKTDGAQAQAANIGSELSMVDYAKSVANQFAPGANRADSRKSAAAFKLKES